MNRTGTVLPASLDQASHRCLALAGRFGTIRLTRPGAPNVREFVLELDDPFGSRQRWTLKKVATFERRYPEGHRRGSRDDLESCDPEELDDLASDLRRLLRV